MTSGFLALLLSLIDLPVRILTLTCSTALQIPHDEDYGFSFGLGLHPSSPESYHLSCHQVRCKSAPPPIFPISLSDGITHPVPQKSPNPLCPTQPSSTWPPGPADSPQPLIYVSVYLSIYLPTYLLSMYLIHLFDHSNLSIYPPIFLLQFSPSILTSGLVQ